MIDQLGIPPNLRIDDFELFNPPKGSKVVPFLTCRSSSIGSLRYTHKATPGVQYENRRGDERADHVEQSRVRDASPEGHSAPCGGVAAGEETPGNTLCEDPVRGEWFQPQALSAEGDWKGSSGAEAVRVRVSVDRRAPQMRGGYKPMGPRPRDYYYPLPFKGVTAFL